MISTLILLAAFVAFLLAVFGVHRPIENMVALGLMLWVLSVLVGRLSKGGPDA